LSQVVHPYTTHSVCDLRLTSRPRPPYAHAYAEQGEIHCVRDRPSLPARSRGNQAQSLKPHPNNRVPLPAGLQARERLVPRDGPLPTFMPRFPPRSRPPPRGLRSRAAPTVHQTVYPSICQVPKNKAPRRLPSSSACSRKQSAMTIPCLLICDLLFVVYPCASLNRTLF
jgi:hypothetical protein